MHAVKKNKLIFAFVSAVFFVSVFIIESLPSVNGCGTLAADYIPCDYYGRLTWSITSGGWIAPMILWVLANLIYLGLLNNKKNSATTEKNE